MFGGIWSTGEFTVFDPAGFSIDPGQGLTVPKEDGAYTLLYIAEQTLWMDCCNKSRNISVLSQWGLADEATSPIGWSANVGVLANGFNSARPHDIFGVGYFYTGISNDLQNLVSPLRTLQDVSGVELFYSAAVIQGFQLTADLQIIEPANADNDTAIVCGLRGAVGF
jgi:porin